MASGRCFVTSRPESACNCSQIHSLNGSSFDPVGARSYLGGVSLSIALVIVSRCAPVNL